MEVWKYWKNIFYKIYAKTKGLSTHTVIDGEFAVGNDIEHKLHLKLY